MTNKHTVNTTAESDKVSIATQGDMRDLIEVEGTPGRIAKFSTATRLTSSIITESAGHIGIGTTTPTTTLTVTSTDANSPALFASNNATGGSGIQGESRESNGVLGRSQNSSGVLGVTFASTLPNSGVLGTSTTGGNGVVGFVGDATGVIGSSVRGTGVQGQSGSGTGTEGLSETGTGVVGTSTEGVGVLGSSDRNAAVWGQSRSREGTAGTSTTGTGVLGTSSEGTGVFGFSQNSAGVRGATANSEAPGVHGANYASGGGTGVFGECPNGWGVFGRADVPAGIGVLGQGNMGIGVAGTSDSGTGVFGVSSSGHAGLFWGDVHVTGRLSEGGGGFMIDHPRDPATKTLAHSFVESPDMLNVYNGNVTTDATGEASVTLPDYFEALNQEFRYQLTVIGQFAQAIVAQEIRNNQFTIKTDQPRVKVSWQVTGIRQDPWAVAHRMAAEEEKAAEDKGRYLHPELWGQPEEARVHRSPSRLDRLEELPRLDRLEELPRLDRLEELPRLDRALLEEEWQQMEEFVQRMHQEVP